MLTFSTKPAILFLLFLVTLSSVSQAQKSVKDYVERNNSEKIKKDIKIGIVPQTAGSFDDGHGSTPLLTSVSQLPDTIALASFHIYDIGTSNHIKNVSVTYFSLSESGGNIMANKLLNSTLSKLRESFKAQGVVLLTPDQYLNTKEKKDFYYKTFEPGISKLGKFLSDIETKRNDISVTADGYRAFDIAASSDFRRAESMGGELAKTLNVDALLSIGIELMSDKKNVAMNGVKMTLHGRNPVTKVDKKYVAQNMGNGYYEGQIYAGGQFYFDKPVDIAAFSKGQVVEEKLEGLDAIFWRVC
jgi:hypothetical protein